MRGPFILAPFPNYAVVVQTLISLHGCPEAPLSVAPQIWFLDHNENAKNNIFLLSPLIPVPPPNYAVVVQTLVSLHVFFKPPAIGWHANSIFGS